MYLRGITRFFVLLSLPAALAAAPAPATRLEAENAVRSALQSAGDDARAQAVALVHLAWPDKGRDPAIGARARQEIVDFGAKGIPTLSHFVSRVKPEYRADVLSAMIESRQFVSGAVPPEYVSGLEDALWFGTREAKLRALDEIALFRDAASVLPLIDSMLDDPELLPRGIETLGAIGDDRARFFLEGVLNQGQPGIRERAAVALARIGGRAIAPLKSALRSGSREIRLLAARALLPVVGEDDLGALYDYVTEYPDDDAETIAAVKDSTRRIEQILEMRRNADSADAPQDF